MRALRGAMAALALVAGLAGTVRAAEPAPGREGISRRLDNGLEVVVIRRTRLPIVQIQLVIPAGVAQEPPGAGGIANATVQLLRYGTTSRSAAAFDADLDRLGGSITANAARDYSTIVGQFRSASFEEGLELLADAVIHPVFPPEEVDRFRSISAGALIQLRQGAAGLADEQTWPFAFAGHPYGRPVLGSVESAAQLTRDPIAAFHRDQFRPARALLVVAGDVDAERAFAVAKETFDGWAGAAPEPKAAPAPAPQPGVRVRIVDRPGQRQAELRVVALAPGRGAPDFLPLQLGNYLFGGGGFSSRLTQSVRVAGLSYDVRSAYTALREAGLVTVSASARSDSAAIVVARIRDEMRRFAASPPTDAEVEAARQFIRRVHPLQFETLGGLAGPWVTARLEGRPDDASARALDAVGAVTRDQIAVAAKRWIDPDRVGILAVGPAAELAPLLAPLGPVEVVTVDGAPARAATLPAETPADPARRTRGRATVTQAITAHGGMTKLRNVKDSVIDGDMSLGGAGMRQTITGKVEQVRKEPAKLLITTEFGAVNSQQILDGDRAWERIAAGDSVVVADGDSLSVLGLRAGFASDVVHLLLAALDPASGATWAGEDFVDGRAVDLVEFGAGADVKRLAIDAVTHRLLAMDQLRLPNGVYTQRRLYKDYRPVSGVLWPFFEERLVNGQRVLTLQLRTVAVNVGVPDSRFTRPAAKRAYPGR